MLWPIKLVEMGHVTHFNQPELAAIKPVVEARAAIVVSEFLVYAKAFKVMII